MDFEQRDKLRESARRQHNNCPNCGGLHEERDGADVGGLPGIKYQHCNACGWTRAKVTRQKRFKL